MTDVFLTGCTGTQISKITKISTSWQKIISLIFIQGLKEVDLPKRIIYEFIAIKCLENDSSLKNMIWLNVSKFTKINTTLTTLYYETVNRNKKILDCFW